MANFNFQVNDHIAAYPRQDAIPGDTIMVLGTSVKQPVGQDVIIGKMSELTPLYGGYPVKPEDIINGTLSEDQKRVYIDALRRNLTYNFNQSIGMYPKGRDPVVIAVRVGEYKYSNLEFRENAIAIDNFNRPVISGKRQVALAFEAVEGGDEYNQFAISIEADALGVPKSLSVKYIAPAVQTNTSMTAITDNTIITPYAIDIVGLKVDEIVAKFNSPLNPFAKYIQSKANYTSIQKTGIAYNKSGNTIIVIMGTEDGAYRLKDVKEMTITTTPTEVSFEEGTKQHIFNMKIIKTGAAVLDKPEVSSIELLSVNDSNMHKAFTSEGIPNPSTSANLPDCPYIIKANMTPASELFWNRDMGTYTIDNAFMDSDPTMKLQAWQWKTDPKTLFQELWISEAVVKGIRKPVFGNDEGMVKVESSVVSDGTEIDNPDMDARFTVAYVNKDKEYTMSEDFNISGGLVGKTVKFTFNLNSDDKFRVSELLKTIIIIGYRKVSGTFQPYELVNIPMTFDTVNNKPEYKMAINEYTINKTNQGGTMNPLSLNGTNTAIAKENVGIYHNFVPKMIFQNSQEKLSEWNTYTTSGAVIIFGAGIPVATTLKGELSFKHTMKKGVDYVIASQGDSPYDDTDTIQFKLNPNGSTQMSSITNGTIDINYEVTPALPSPTNGVWSQLKGGLENSLLSDEDYLNLCLEKLREYAPKYQPTRIYVCGLYMDFSKTVFNPTTALEEKTPLDPIMEIGQLIDSFNVTFPTRLHMSGNRHYITTTIGKEIKEFASKFEESLRSSNTVDLFSPTYLKAKHNTHNLRVAQGLLYSQNTTIVNGRTLPYILPVDAGLISIRNSVLQTYEMERTAENFIALPSSIKSFLKGAENADSYNFYGFEVYSEAYTNNGQTAAVRAVSDATAAIRDPEFARGRDYQIVDDATAKSIQSAMTYLKRYALNQTGQTTQQIETHEKMISDNIKSEFANTRMIKGVTAKLTTSSEAAAIAGIADLMLELNFNTTFRKFNVIVNLKIG